MKKQDKNIRSVDRKLAAPIVVLPPGALTGVAGGGESSEMGKRPLPH